MRIAMNPKAFFAEPRRRNLAILALAAAVSLTLAAAALHTRAAETAPRYPSHPVFDGLEGKLRKAASIRIETKNGVFDIVFQPTRGWVLPGRNDYPASFETVRQTLYALAYMKTVEPKTARPEWLHYIDLDAPPKGNGALITVKDGDGKPLATLIVGKTGETGDPNGAFGMFVRKPGEAQSWLVSSPYELHTAPGDWMEKTIIDIDRARIAAVSFRPAKGAGFTVRRASPAVADFVLDPLPKGRTLIAPTAPAEAAVGLAGFAIEDARPRTDFDFDNPAAQVVLKTFDGLSVGVDVVKDGGDYWARLYADAAGGNPEAGNEASVINAKAFGWAFKLPAFKGAQLTATLDSLLAPKK
jgi:hypothetical protein